MSFEETVRLIQDALFAGGSTSATSMNLILQNLVGFNYQVPSLGGTSADVAKLNKLLISYAEEMSKVLRSAAKAQQQKRESLGNEPAATASPAVAEAVADSVR